MRTPIAIGAFRCALAAVLLAALATSCARTSREERLEQRRAALRAEVADYLPPEETPPDDPLYPYYASLSAGGAQDAVRNGYALAVRAMALGRMEEAARVADAMIAELERSSAGDKAARRARSKFHKEESKLFRGEPYEQAMIFLLRGLLYMQEGDYENARAAFRSGALVDRSSMDAPPEEQYHDDLAEMDYLEGLCNLMLGDYRAEECFDRARSHARHAGAVLTPPENFDAIVVLLSGNGPTKFRDGQYGEILRFSPGDGAGGPVQLSVNGQPAANAPGPLDNMSFQATTRGGREIDGILRGKAIFKTSTGIAGTAAIAAGAGLLATQRNNDAALGAGIGLIVAGLIATGVSAASQPEADIRALKPMPDDIYIFPLRLEAGAHALRLNNPARANAVERRIEHPGEGLETVVIWSP